MFLQCILASLGMLWYLTLADICCVPEQWSAIMKFEEEIVFIDTDKASHDHHHTTSWLEMLGKFTHGRHRNAKHPETAFVIFNYTVDVAYDTKLKKIAMVGNSTEQSPLVSPNPVNSDIAILIDYSAGMHYTVQWGQCQKEKLDHKMPAQCVPDDANFVSKELIGNKTWSNTYSFPMAGTELPLTATFYQSGHDCYPISAKSLSGSVRVDSGTLFFLELYNIEKRILKPSIFDVPKECQ